VPRELAREITAALSIPTIGIGAGVDCDGQVLVMHDLLGLSDTPPPRFVRQYVALGGIVRRAVEMWTEDVRNQKFPGDAESY
jgi:3-methyl-2-oxobutanoate hydroxymethyltransferase